MFIIGIAPIIGMEPIIGMKPIGQKLVLKSLPIPGAILGAAPQALLSQTSRRGRFLPRSQV